MKMYSTYGRTDLTYRISLRSRPDRNIVVFRIDRIVGRSVDETIYLDRAETPLDDAVWNEWRQVIDDILENGITHRYGIQLHLGDRRVTATPVDGAPGQWLVENNPPPVDND